jgi:hypothetical protein
MNNHINCIAISRSSGQSNAYDYSSRRRGISRVNLSISRDGYDFPGGNGSTSNVTPDNRAH